MLSLKSIHISKRGLRWTYCSSLDGYKKFIPFSPFYIECNLRMPIILSKIISSDFYIPVRLSKYRTSHTTFNHHHMKRRRSVRWCFKPSTVNIVYATSQHLSKWRCVMYLWQVFNIHYTVYSICFGEKSVKCSFADTEFIGRRSKDFLVMSAAKRQWFSRLTRTWMDIICESLYGSPEILIYGRP